MSRSEVDIEKLLRDLQSEEASRRKIAAENLGELTTSNEQIASALLTVWESDSNRYVKHAAEKALLAPAHLAILQQRSDWAEKITMLQPQISSSSQQHESAQSELPRPLKKIVGVGGVLLVIAIAVWLVYDNVGYWNGGDFSGPVVNGDGYTRSQISRAAHWEFRFCGGDKAIPEAIKLYKKFRSGAFEEATMYIENGEVKGFIKSSTMADGSVRNTYYTVASDGSEQIKYTFSVQQPSAYIYRLDCY